MYPETMILDGEYALQRPLSLSLCAYYTYIYSVIFYSTLIALINSLILLQYYEGLKLGSLTMDVHHSPPYLGRICTQPYFNHTP